MSNWTELSQITTGGTVLSIADAEGRGWLASRAGLFAQTDARWHPIVREVPFWGMSSVLQAGDDLLVAGLPDGLIRSGDGGRHWRKATIEQTAQPITCLAASPNYAQDSVVLAGTAGDGVLRSSDGGRYWEVQGWGFDNLDVLAIAVAPEWGRRQHVVASTADGLYRSPNGGRGWQRADAPDGLIVPALLYVSAEIILGGSEAAGLILSTDGGHRWQLHRSALDGLTINALLRLNSGAILAATGEGVIGISADNGQTWRTVAVSETPILALCEQPNRILAGVVDGGLLQSADQGQTWQQAPNLSINRFAWLVGDETHRVAAGPETGVWLSADGGTNWQRTAFDGMLNGVGIANQQIYALSGRQVLQLAATNPTGTPTVVFEPNDEPLWIAAHGERLWVGLRGGDVAFRPNEAAQWRALPVPFKRQTMLGGVISADFDADQSLLVATQETNDFNVWHSRDGGQTWRNLLNERRLAAAPQLVLTQQLMAVSVGNLCYVNVGQGWQQRVLDDAAAPITALASMGGQQLLAISADHVHQFDGTTWHSTPHLDPIAVVDLLHTTSQTLALMQDGHVLSAA